MSSIHERRFAQVPLTRAPQYIDGYIRDVETEGAGQINLRVRVPLERVGVDRCLEISKTVCVRFGTPSSPMHVGRLTPISWKPASGGPFPHFSGTIGVEADESADACCLTLDGLYDPPFGSIGDAFDAVVGKHIARLTARNLLDEIAFVIESAHNRGAESAG